MAKLEPKFYFKEKYIYTEFMFKLYIDADSLPKQHRKIILNRIVKENIESYFAADRELSDVLEAKALHTAQLRSPFKDTLDKQELRKIKSSINMVVVSTGANSADDKLVEIAEAPGIAITHDIPLAARLLEKGISVIDDRGNEYTSDDIKERLSIRSVMADFREMGIFDDKSKRFDDRTINAFANSFDRLIDKYKKR